MSPPGQIPSGVTMMTLIYTRVAYADPSPDRSRQIWPIRPSGASGRQTGRAPWKYNARHPQALWTRLTGFWLILVHRVVTSDTTHSA